MSYRTASLVAPAPIYVSPWAWNSVGPNFRGSANSLPSSGSGPGFNVAIYTPFWLPKPYTMQRFWWLNGGTVGTDTLQSAIYAVDGSGVLDCVVACPPTLSAGTASQLAYTNPSVVGHLITSGNSTTDGTTFTTASVTLKARPGVMYALSFVNSKASAANVATTVETTGSAQAFTSRNSQTYGASTEGRVNLWTCVPTADVTATITITFGSTQTGCAWVLLAFTNVDTTTNHGVVQTAVGSGNSTTPLATLSAFGSANNATLGLNANLADTTTTPGTGFWEMADVNYATPTNCLQVQVSQNDTTSDGTITSGQWGALAAEIKSIGTAVALPAGKYFMAFWSTATTATVFRVTGNQGIDCLGIFTQLSLPTGLPFTATPVAQSAGNGMLINHGITSRSSP